MKYLRLFKMFFLENLHTDLIAGVVVFFVALPLCVGLSSASNAPVFSGIITSIVAGLVISFLSGSKLSISGPAAGLVVLISEAILQTGSYEHFLACVFLAGILQLIFSFLKAGSLSSVVPSSVLKGMVAALGVIIILKQLPHGLGRSVDLVGNFSFQEQAQNTNSNIFSGIGYALKSFNLAAFITFILSLASILLWNRASSRQIKIAKHIPASAIAILLGILMTFIFDRFSATLSLQQDLHFINLPTFQNMGEVFGIFRSPDFSTLNQVVTFKYAILIALMCSTETLLCLEVTDKLDPTRRVSSKNRELFAQGIGNIICGSIGGLPMTSVIVRTYANIFSGARSAISSFTHGLLLLITVFFFGAYLSKIPMASLAAILVWVGYRLSSIQLIRKVYATGWDQFIPFVVTFLGIIFTDLFTGILLGIIVGSLVILRTNYYSAITIVNDRRDYLVKFTKDVSFINKVRLEEQLALIPSGSNVVIDGTKALFIDYDIYQVIDDFLDRAEKNGTKVELKSIDSNEYRSVFKWMARK